MSSVIIAGDTSGSVTLAAPAVAGTTTLTLPATSGTVLTTTSPKVGNVIQVVNVVYSVNNSSSSSTFADTGLTASITPTSSTSKILVCVTIAGIGKLNNARAAFNLVRNSTTISTIEVNSAWDNTAGYNYIGGSGLKYLDSPATVSATTYKVQFASTTNIAVVQMNVDGATSSITLMEIAA